MRRRYIGYESDWEVERIHERTDQTGEVLFQTSRKGSFSARQGQPLAGMYFTISWCMCMVYQIYILYCYDLFFAQVWSSLMLYRKILEAIEENDYNNFTKRAYVRRSKKLLTLPLAYTKAISAPSLVFHWLEYKKQFHWGNLSSYWFLAQTLLALKHGCINSKSA